MTATCDKATVKYSGMYLKKSFKQGNLATVNISKSNMLLNWDETVIHILFIDSETLVNKITFPRMEGFCQEFRGGHRNVHHLQL